MQGLLEGKHAIVTGGTSGIGRAIALLYAKQGANVCIFGRNEARGQEVTQTAKEQTGRDSICFQRVNVSKKEEVDKAIQKSLNKFPQVDILVNCAGITKDQLFLRMTEQDFTDVLNVNLLSCVFTSQALIRPFIKARQGKIINISSVVGLIGNPGQTNYAASKAGMIGFSKSLAKEVARKNITVNCIAPGYIQTPMTDAIAEGKQKELIQHIPLGRMGSPEDIAQSALFLASSMGDYITGQTIIVDGGLAM